jgi:hypothetical protein
MGMGLEDTSEVMAIALRVFTAISHKRRADPKDVEALEAIAGPKPSGMDLDEFTCFVVQEALKHRARRRTRQ